MYVCMCVRVCERVRACVCVGLRNVRIQLGMHKHFTCMAYAYMCAFVLCTYTISCM